MIRGRERKKVRGVRKRWRMRREKGESEQKWSEKKGGESDRKE